MRWELKREGCRGVFGHWDHVGKVCFQEAKRLWEDTLTLTSNDGLLTVEGQRKDVVRASMRIESYLSKRADQNQE